MGTPVDLLCIAHGTVILRSRSRKPVVTRREAGDLFEAPFYSAHSSSATESARSSPGSLEEFDEVQTGGAGKGNLDEQPADERSVVRLRLLHGQGAVSLRLPSSAEAEALVSVLLPSSHGAFRSCSCPC